MAHRSNHGSRTQDDLFTGLKFWLSRQVPMRSHFEERMKRKGAILVTNEADADMRIVDDARRNLPVGDDYYSYKFVEESMKNNRLEDPKKYAIGLKSAADRPVGSMNVTAKRTRKPFTREDDQILYNWLEPYRQSGGSWKGNKIYEQLARKHPQHTFQSWRSRFLFIVANCTKMTVTQPIDPFASSDNEDVPGPQERSPKRRRLNGPQPASAQHQPTASPRRIPPIRPHGTTSVRNSSPTIQPSEQVVAASERTESVREDSVGGNKSIGLAKSLTDPQSKYPNKLTSTLAPVLPSESAAQSHADKATEENQDSAERKTTAPFTNPVSNESNDSELKLSAFTSDENPSRHQVFEADDSPGAGPKLRKFTREEARELYRAVPYIHNVEPQNIDQSWESLVQERRSRHTVAEWRLFYETTILPEYMRRNNLETREDLDDHVADLLAEEQYVMSQKQEIKEEPVLGDIPTAVDQASKELEHIQEETATVSPSHVLQPSRGQGSREADIENDVSDDPREPSPIPKSQTILTTVEVRQNGELIAKESGVLQPQSQPSQSPVNQSLVISPKKRLFGRTLDAGMISSQLQSPKTTASSTRVNEVSFGTASTTSALVSLPSQSVASSKRPPESGQRPPRSATTSQEEPIVHDAADRAQDKTSHLNALPDDDRTLSNAILDASPTSPASSPTLGLLWEEDGQDHPIPSSPALSDTGSEYMAFDTAPQRSQLWELSEDETRDEVVDNENEDQSDDEGPRNTQYSKGATQRKQSRENLVPKRVATPIPPEFQSGEDDLIDEQLEPNAQIEAEGSPEFDVQATTSVKVVTRTETQMLFDQSVPEIEEDTTIFDLPSPEGGWEQFSDVEDEFEDVHASVEVADHDLSEHRAASSSSETNEAAGPVGAGEDNLDAALAEEAFVISDHESEFTTSSGDVESPTPNERIRVQQQKPRIHPVSDGSERTASSPTVSSQLRAEEEDYTDNSSTSSEDQSTIESWFSNQPKFYTALNPRIVKRLASTALQATVLNLPAATFTLRDMVASFGRSEATRRAQFQVDTRMKREYSDSVSLPKFEPKIELTEEEARSLLPRDVLGVWTIEDDRSFLSQTVEGLESVKRKHGAAGVRKRAKFLRIRYGEGAVSVSVSVTPKSRLGSTRRQR